MKKMKLNVHSVVDLITNSSTTIYTFSDGSEETVKDMINEMLKVFGSEQTADDLFWFGVFNEDYDYYDYVKNYEELEALINDILKGKVEKPEWMKEQEDSDYSSGSNLQIIAKDDKYKELGEKIISFLYSTDSRECDC